MGKIEKIGFDNQEKWDCRYLDSVFCALVDVVEMVEMVEIKKGEDIYETKVG